MSTVIAIAAGVVLAVIVLAFWRELLTFALVAVAGLSALLVLFVFRSELAAFSETEEASLIGSLLLALLSMAISYFLAWSLGSILERNTSLRRSEAYILAAGMYVAVVATAVSFEWLLTQHLERRWSLLTLGLCALVCLWALVVTAFHNRLRRRARIAKRASTRSGANAA